MGDVLRFGSATRGALVGAGLLVLTALPAPAQGTQPSIGGTPLTVVQTVDTLPEPEALAALAQIAGALQAATAEDAALSAFDAALRDRAEWLFDSGREDLRVALLSLSAEIARLRFGDDSPEHARALASVANSHAFWRGDPAAAEPLARRAVALARQAAADLDVNELPGLLAQHASILSALDRPAEAVPLRREVVEYWRGVLEPGHIALEPRLRALAQDLEASGAMDEAEAAHVEAAAILRQTHGPDHVLRVAPLLDFARFLQARGDAEGAFAMRVEALRVLGLQVARARADRADDPYQLPRWLGQLADVAAALGETDRATALHLQAVALVRQGLGDGHPLTAEAVADALAHARGYDPDNAELRALATAFPGLATAD